MKILARIFAICGLLGLIAAIVGTGIFLSGAYHVGATTRHSAIVNSLLASTMERSVRAHARQVAMPADLRLDDLVEAARGAGHYQEMCVTCHGAPGRDPAEWAKDLHPTPPDLTQPAVAKHWSDAEIFWIIKYGIKDTGMAAFGPTHDDDNLWALTALVRQLPSISVQSYDAMVAQAGDEGHEEKPEEHQH